MKKAQISSSAMWKTCSDVSHLDVCLVTILIPPLSLLQQVIYQMSLKKQSLHMNSIHVLSLSTKTLRTVEQCTNQKLS